MTITLTVFDRSPDGGRGLARDTRVRWALEEVGQPYAVQRVAFAELQRPEYLALHPFGQIPTYAEDGLVLFETGAIVLHLAQRHAGLLPDDPVARARAIAWLFAALNTVEPPILELANAGAPARRCRVDRGRFQRGRSDDGVGAAAAPAIGAARRISQPRRLCRARRSASGVRARIRGAARDQLPR